MTQVKNIFQRINEVMKEVEAVQKESKKVNNMYTFVSHDAVTKALHMPMVRAGIVMVTDVAELTRDGNKTTAKMYLTFVNIDEPSDRFTVTSYGDGIDPQDKGIGKAVSYAVKYGLLKTFCLETGDDVEKDSIEYEPTKPEAKVKEPKPKVTEVPKTLQVKRLSFAQVEEVVKALNADKDKIKFLCDFYQVKLLGEIPEDRFENIMNSIKNRITNIKEKSA